MALLLDFPMLAQVQKGAIVAAGALVTPGTVVPSGQQLHQLSPFICTLCCNSMGVS